MLDARANELPQTPAGLSDQAAVVREPPGCDLDLGLAVLHALAPGRRFTQEEIAECCGVRSNRIQTIERRALDKLRHHPQAGLMREMLASLAGRPTGHLAHCL